MGPSASRISQECCRRQWFKTCYSLLLFLLTLASRRPSKLDPPHADTRSGIDASWLVCRGADDAPRLRSSPPMAQEPLVSFPSFFACAISGASSFAPLAHSGITSHRACSARATRDFLLLAASPGRAASAMPRGKGGYGGGGRGTDVLNHRFARVGGR